MYRRVTISIVLAICIICIAISPKISTFDDISYINVEVKGEVVQEKIIKLPLGSTILDLLDYIELNENSDIDKLSKLEILYNNQIIVIPAKDNEDKISINSANLYELSVLPGIGKSTALKIIEYRKEFGSFIKLEDLKNVSGIGDRKYEKIKPYICL